MVATSNDINSLPPELIRKGRLDEIFFVDLPDLPTREEIFAIHLRKRDFNPDQFDLKLLAQQTEGFSGAEIEQSVVAAMYSASAQKIDMTEHLIVQEIRNTAPLSIIMAEKLAALKQWADGRTVNANYKLVK